MTADNQANDPELLPKEVVARLLREYTDNARAADQRYQNFLGLGAAMFVAVCVSVVWLIVQSVSGSPTGVAWMLSAASFFLLMLLAVLGGRMKPGVELSIWQLRRVYQIGSRLVDVGARLNFAQRVELELKLSEAQFLLKKHEHKLANPPAGLWQLELDESPFRAPPDEEPTKLRSHRAARADSPI
ncbi:hypothetical protein [Enhygromyxa salina]|uniref:hypothetical protein n=1 Tax=Enhygromyxa salina TaxID=215803 RepID=UPI0011B24149|nr:hypothetical protein [Enhygromyxa salina]